MEDGFALFARSEREYTSLTPFPFELVSWSLLSTKMAFSDTHIDSSGLATRVKMIHGSKLWLINTSDGIPSGSIDPSDCDDSGVWIPVLLKPGHELYVNILNLCWIELS